MTPFVLLCAIRHVCTEVGQPAGPTVTADAAIVVHADTGRILWGRNIHRKTYPASTTKILTTLILLENSNPDDRITAPQDTKKIPESSLHLVPGESISAKDAAYALMLRSANDVAHAVAVHFDGSDAGFARRMDAYAIKIGMRDSHFENPNGLPSPWHKTTAYDLAVLGIHARKNNQLVEISRTQTYSVTRDPLQKDTLLVNRNKLLKEDPNNWGFKTGFTNDAGRCFVGYVKSPVGDLVTVILGSVDWAGDQTALSRWAAGTFKLIPDIAEAHPVSIRAQNQSGDIPLSLAPAKPVAAILSQNDMDKMKVELPVLKAPIKKGEPVGMVAYSLPDGTVYKVPVVAANAVEAQFAPADALRNPAAWVLLAAAGGAYWYRRRAYDRLNS